MPGTRTVMHSTASNSKAKCTKRPNFGLFKDLCLSWLITCLIMFQFSLKNKVARPRTTFSHSKSMRKSFGLQWQENSLIWPQLESSENLCLNICKFDKVAIKKKWAMSGRG